MSILVFRGVGCGFFMLDTEGRSWEAVGSPTMENSPRMVPWGTVFF